MSHKSSSLKRSGATATNFENSSFISEDVIPHVPKSDKQKLVPPTRGSGRGRGRLQTNRVPDLEAARRPIGRLLARRPAARRIIRRSRIEAQAGDHRKRVAVASINGDPFSRATAPVNPEFFRVHRDAHEAGSGQGIGNRAGTVVGGVVKGFVASAKSIRLGPQLVGGPDRALNGQGSVYRGERQLAIQFGLISGSRGPGRRKGAGKAGLCRKAKDHGAHKGFSDRDS